MITAKTKKVGLISWPIEHSLSPIMHNAAFEALGMDWTYLPLPTKEQHLENGIHGLKALSFEGCNVSVPYKTKVIQYLDEIDSTVQKMKAVNTIKIKDGKLIGYNTDPIGFIRSLLSNDIDPVGLNILIIGAGGAARAALFGLSEFDVNHISIMDKVESQAVTLIHDLASLFQENKLDFFRPVEDNFENLRKHLDLVVNATPVGMFPEIDVSPWPDGVALPDNALFYDIVYNPEETKFLSRANSEGHKTISGLGMLVNQGIASFEIWTGITPPKELMYKVCKEELGHN